MTQQDEDERAQDATNNIEDSATRSPKTGATSPVEFDPRIIEIVRFLARTAAEKDYAELIARTRREPEGEKERPS